MHSLQCSNCSWSSVTNSFIDSKVIKRLVAMNSSVSGDCCMLFVRFEGAPYACLGKVNVINHTERQSNFYPLFLFLRSIAVDRSRPAVIAGERAFFLQ